MAVAPTSSSAHRQARASSVLEVRDLEAAFFTRRGVVRAVNGVSFSIGAGETLGLVGESGCGKTATAMSILRMLPFPGRITGGEIWFQGENLLAKPEGIMRSIRGREIGLIPQDPTASLNPLITIGQHLEEVLKTHLNMRGGAARERGLELLRTVGISEVERRYKAYPHQLSGGMRQRVMIAMAIACRPALLIADEPTTALDATVQAQILELIQTLSRELNMTTLLITHNLGIVARLCDDVAVMYAGQVAETAPRDELFARSRHPYTVSLLRCVPRLDRVGVTDLESIPGQPPDLIRPPQGCTFAPRCPIAGEHCQEEPPALTVAGPDHLASCWYQDKAASMPR